ncbi:MAG: hypothetical protein LH609_16180 [Rudanella sp.]|nr:hypothetical protein [Rudanella sp.]
MLIQFSNALRFGVAPFLAGLLLIAPSFAQTAANMLPRLATDQLKLPANWQRAGSLMALPTQSTFKTGPGNTLLVGNAGQALMLVPSSTDFALQTDVLMTPGASAQLTLPTGQTLPLTDPRLGKAPGLWQTVDIRYRAATTSRPAILDRLVINGVTLREGQMLPRSATNSPITITVQNGSVALRNVGYRGLNNRSVAKWAGPLNYSIYEGETLVKSDLPSKKLIKKDTTSAISFESAYGIKPRNFTILFSGKLNLTDAGTYQFDLDYGGRARLFVDGKEVITGDYKDLGVPMSVEILLTAGNHDVEVLFGRAWQRPGLGLYVSLPNTRPQALHTLMSLPEPDPISVISVLVDAKPVLIRSFVQLPGEKLKRTHSLSVGTPAGMHYTLDLNQMAILQVWKGDFADVTEMWYERGEPQLLKPLGANVLLAPQTALMVMNDPNMAWPDSVSETILQYKGMALDKQGMPTTEYALGGATVTDAITPNPGSSSLTRILTLKGSANGPIVCRLAAGTKIEELSPGLYAVNDRSYYIRVDPALKPELRTANGKQELRLPVKSGVTYEIVF